MVRGRLGRPPLPEEQRKRTITVYLGASMVDRIDHRAHREGRSRNQLIAAILHDHFEVSEDTTRGDAPAGARLLLPEGRGER